MITVRCIATGYYLSLREPGDVFQVPDDFPFPKSPVWLEKVDPIAEATTAAAAIIRRAEAEIEAAKIRVAQANATAGQTAPSTPAVVSGQAPAPPKPPGAPPAPPPKPKP